MRRLLHVALISALISGAFVAWGCRPSADDPGGQAGDLADPLRRQGALTNIHRLYTGALARKNGNREDPAVKAIADATIDKLVETYIAFPEDNQNGQTIIDLLSEMRDLRGLPALVKALHWRAEVNEEHAIRAATTLKHLDIPADKKAEVIEALSEALDRIQGARGADNRMRIEFIRALGGIGDNRATPILTKVALAQSENQNFLINRLAAEQIGRIGDPAAVPAMVQGLFVFAASNPAMRMNDVAAEALVRIGRPSYEPLLAVLRGQCEECNAIAQQYIEAVRERNAEAAGQMSVAMLTNAEATFALGALGFREALDPLIAATEGEDLALKMQSAIALVRLNLEPGDLPRVREVLKTVYASVEANMKPQLIAAMRHLYDPEMQTFFMEQAADRELFPFARIEAVKAYSFLANKAEAERMQAFIAREPSSAAERNAGDREAFDENAPLLAAAVECDESVDCWKGKLDSDDLTIVRKAAYALGRFGRGNDEAIGALVAKLGHTDLEVRLAVITALDRIAVAGSQAAVDKIDELRQTEEGRSIWTNFQREALPIQARLRTRLGS